MINARDEKKEQFDTWYGDDRFRTRSPVEYDLFLKNLLHEAIYYFAHVYGDAKRLEGWK